MEKEQLIMLVKRIMAAGGTEEEQDRNLQLLKQHVPDPHASDLIFWPNREMSTEEIVDTALAYVPIIL
jgi:hypothetical protein